MRRRWTPEEDEVLRGRYADLGPSSGEWRRLLPGRSTASVKHRAERLGLTSPHGWSLAEDAEIRAHYHAKGACWDGWEDLLPGRTPEAIRTHAVKIGATRYRRHIWTPSEDEVVRERYPVLGPSSSEWETLLPGRTLDAIRKRALDMGVRYRGPIERWTPEEDRALADNVRRGMDWPGWRDVLPGRTRSAIQRRASCKGLTTSGNSRYTIREDEQLARVLDLVSERLGRPRERVASRMVYLARRQR